jgi:hypothetical protein
VSPQLVSWQGATDQRRDGTHVAGAPTCANWICSPAKRFGPLQRAGLQPVPETEPLGSRSLGEGFGPVTAEQLTALPAHQAHEIAATTTIGQVLLDIGVAQPLGMERRQPGQPAATADSEVYAAVGEPAAAPEPQVW